MIQTALVTGVTGLLGGSLVLELLRATEAEVVCLVRPKDSRRAGERMRRALDLACRLYDDEALLDEVACRCSVLEGDVTQPDCGVAKAARRRIDEAWHGGGSAASTGHFIALAGELGATSWNYFTTVAEPSWPQAEQIAAVAAIERVRIFRPGIVIGHSETFAAAGGGEVGRLAGELREGQLGSCGERLLRLVADPGLPLDCVPVDRVAAAAVAISRSDSAERVFHLTNSAPRTVGEGLAAVAERTGVSTLRFVASADGLSAAELRLDELLAPYRSYLDESRQTDRGSTETVLGPGCGRYPLADEALAAHFDWYLRQAEGFGEEVAAKVEVS